MSRFIEGYDEADIEGFRETAEEYARQDSGDDEEECDGSGEIGFNLSPGGEPWNDDSRPCPGCAQCEAPGN